MIYVRRSFLLLLIPVVLALVACSSDDNNTAAGTATLPPTVPGVTESPASPVPVPTTALPESVVLDGETYVAVRTLPPDALSAEKLEPAGAAQTDSQEIQLAHVDAAAVAAWELVSAAPDGWQVWRPQVVLDALDQAGAGAMLVEVEAVDWPDACLGAARADEVCAQVVTPGYRIIIETAGGERIEFHASRMGALRRVESGA